MAVTGIGGVFFKSKDPEALNEWYKTHLGIDIQPWGGVVFEWKGTDGKPVGKTTALRIAPQDDESFAPSTTPFMINYLVTDLDGMLKKLRDDGVEVIGEFNEGEYGKFGWVMDPDGNKIELWEPENK